MASTLENTPSICRGSRHRCNFRRNIQATLNLVILPPRRVMPTVIANELVGVQPTTGPGRSHTSQVRYAESNDNATAGEEFHPSLKLLQHILVRVQILGTADATATQRR